MCYSVFIYLSLLLRVKPCPSHAQDIKYGDLPAFLALCLHMAPCVLIYRQCVVLAVGAAEVAGLLLGDGFPRPDDLHLHLGSPFGPKEKHWCPCKNSYIIDFFRSPP